MKTIWKYPLMNFATKVSMPHDAKILTVQLQDGIPMLWALVESDHVTIPRLFAIYGTGHEITPGEWDYIGTFQTGSLVWHVFEAA